MTKRESEKTVDVLENLDHQVLDWRNSFWEEHNGNRPVLEMVEGEDRILIHDTRPCAVASELILNGAECAIYRACRKPIRKEALFKFFLSNDSVAYSEKIIESSLQELIEKKLLIDIRGQYLALATLKPKAKIVPLIVTIRKLCQHKPKQVEKDAAWQWLKSL